MKNRISSTALLLALALTTGLTHAQSSQTTKSGVVITDLTFGPSEWTHGYIEHRYTLENPTPLRRTVTLETPDSSYSHGRGIESLSATVTLEAGAKAQLSMPQPPLTLNGNGLAALVKGMRKESLGGGGPSYQDYSNQNNPALLLSKSLSAEALKERLLNHANPDHSTSHRSRHSSPPPMDERFNVEALKELKPLRFERDPSGWSPNWLAYSGFDACVLAVDDYAKMPEEVRTGLRTYVAAGGQVTFLGMSQIPGEWTETGKPAGGSKNSTDGLCETRLGFGRVQALDHANLKGITSNQAVRLVHSWHQTRDPLKLASASYGYYRRGYGSVGGDDYLTAIPIKSGLQVSATLFLLILLTFALLTGPGVVIYTSRANRRIWLLWLVPAFSLTFSVAILVFMLYSEGITPSIHCQAVTLLDQKEHQAATLGAIGIYAPLSIADGLQFDRGTEVVAMGQNHNQRSCRIVWGQHQHFTSGWITPRIPAFFRLRRSEPRSERVIVTEQPQGVEVVNMLGVPIRRLLLCDSHEKMYEAFDLKPGEKRSLTSSGQRNKADPSALAKVRQNCLTAAPGWDIEKQDELLLSSGPKNPYTPAASSYVARLNGCPFIENPIGYGTFKGSFTAIVVGSY